MRKKISFILFTGVIISCAKDDVSEVFPQDDSTTEVISTSNNFPKATSCNETSFPNQGPNTKKVQTCQEVSNPINIGKLDCRAKGVGGYSQKRFGGTMYGVYKLRGGLERYDGTLTRVERSFSAIANGKDKSATFTALFVVNDLGDRKTNIAQIHAGSSKILYGLKKGQTAVSAVLGIGVEKTSNPNRFKMTVSRSVEPYTTTSRGKRTSTNLRNITKNVVYRLTFTTGFNSNKRAFSIVKVERANNSNDTEELAFNHTFTTEKVSMRYGAYETADSGDTGAEIRFRNTRLCRTN